MAVAHDAALSFSETIKEAPQGKRKLFTYWDPQVMVRGLAARSKPPAFVVLDILNQNRNTRLDPKGNCGIAVAKRLNERRPRVPIIFLSFFDEDDPERELAGEVRSIREYVRKGRGKTEQLLTQAV